MDRRRDGQKERVRGGGGVGDPGGNITESYYVLNKIKDEGVNLTCSDAAFHSCEKRLFSLRHISTPYKKEVHKQIFTLQKP